MLPIADPVFYAFAVPAVLVVGLAKGGFAGPLGLLGVPLMALVIPPVQAAAIMLPILIAMDMAGLAAYRKSFDTKSLAILLPGALVGIGIGYLTAAQVSDAHVRLLVGLVAILFAANAALGGAFHGAPRPHRPWAGRFWGAISGFTSFVSHAGGPPFQFYMLPLRLDPVRFAGTAVVFFTTVNAVKLVPYTALGQFDTRNLATSAVLLPLAPLATFAGVWLVKHVDASVFYKITYAAVGLIGLKLLWDGVAGILA
ncbi:sulfite exporter TauE/SafE family protein [Stappia sp.]|uniref:sulfite exporter TauE/SafE family protein n=1 Tax=Stappia sp. TaxID=1870903 RepID=UPI0032D8CDD9